MGAIPNEHELIQAAKAGDKHAFDTLIQKYRLRLHQVLKRYQNLEGMEPEDLLQEVILKAYRSIETFKEESQFYTWLYRIAINTAKNHLHHGRLHHESSEWFDLTVYAWGATEKNSPDHFLIRDEMEKILFQTLNQLPPDLKEALLLREFQSLSYQEIADQLGCPIGTVRSRIFRARELIDQKIKPLLEGPE